MSNLNKVIQQGNLTDPPKFYPNNDENKSVARFSIAVNDGHGEWEKTAFVPCVVFGKQAAIIANHFNKGKQILITGKLVTEKYEDKETGKNRTQMVVELDRYNGFFFTGNAPRSNDESSTTPQEVPAVSASEGTDGQLF